jgi:hypothetical protein
VESLVAAGVFTLVLGGGWMVFRMSRKQASQVMEYSSLLQTAASVTARLQMDLAAAYVPATMDLGNPAFQISADRRSLGFLRSPRVDDVGGAPSTGPGRRWVEWKATPSGPSNFELTRILQADPPRTIRWSGAPLKEVHFALRKYDGQVFVVGEFLFLGPKKSSGAPPRTFPVRVVKRLLSGNRLSTSGIPSPPGGITTTLPAATTAAIPLPASVDIPFTAF